MNALEDIAPVTYNVRGLQGLRGQPRPVDPPYLFRNHGFAMSIQLPPDEQQAAEALVATGRFTSIEEVITEGVRRLAMTEELRSKVQIGIDQADRGEMVDHETAFERLRTQAASYDEQTG
jgi:antitoxin ParD1/3/4